MERYAIWEGFMNDFEKKVAAIQKKCNKFGCDFHFEKVGEEIREVEDYTRRHPVTNKPMTVKCKFIICEVEGTAVINGWQFVASVEHTEKGNIFSKALTDVEIPERYRTSDTYCEHCNSRRMRKGTFIVMNTESGEFKQVGQNCLHDFTHGMSASCAAYMASLKTIFEEEEEKPIGLSLGYNQRYYNTEEVLRFAAETIRHFGFKKSKGGDGFDNSDSTKTRVNEFFNLAHGETRFWEQEDIDRVRGLMEKVGFDEDSKEAKKMVKDALEWLDGQDACNDYMHNLKVVTALQSTTHDRFGLLISLFPTWNKQLEREAKRKLEAEAGKNSEFVGNVGDRVSFEVESVKCITSWESCFNGYTTTTTYVWKITGKDGNIYTWKTATYMDEDRPPVAIKGTVKEHKTYRDVKQTELTRCKFVAKV